ncbi:MAG: GGDEF domain-containing protein [Candidatus Eisenbacteria bacterium]|uniref:GGDEF domain-containing protein n=1 Tax=Eiseniibacteriota bacterium TaxID=2212470 RepID=A0A849SGD9_UNCEI|nr:GGDEF domain-containing protein [Candidatus Eisenbacteria bacterium]
MARIAMNRQHIDFRELLERVLPLESLPPLDRMQIDRALQTGLARQIEDAALFAIGRLEDEGVLRRLPGEEGSGNRMRRYQPREGLSIITLELPAPVERDGVVAVPRRTLPAGAVAGLDQMRRLLRLDDPSLLADRGSSTTPERDLLDRAGREFLRALAVRFYAAGVDTPAGDDPPIDRELIEQAIHEPGRLFYCPHTAQSRRLVQTAARRGVPALGVCAVAPVDGEPLGALEVRAPAHPTYGPEDLARFALLADAYAVVLQRRARVEQLVFVDTLTGSFNRPYFDRQLENEIARSRRERETMALLIADVDDFKVFNTAYGYEAGNQVLQQVALALRRGVRPFDTVARWGGEEFAVVLTGPVQADDVIMISERLRSAVQRMALRLEGLDGRTHAAAVTVSIGVALCPEHGHDAPALWRSANRALLEAKATNKNRVVIAMASGE